ncbi:DEAD-box ATP-dependent RNA helicase 50 [Nymphaea colorata]|nr:DEAD-box ATP-dependent RNA helicase 50 [Nymphaea colorata]
MLLAAPPTLSLCERFVLPLRLRPLGDDGSGLLQPHRNATSRTAALVVRAGYTRKPTGTPGAYHLFDDNTGERFIVWGAADDDSEDFVVPPKEVLTQNPDVPPNSGSGSLDGVVSIGKVEHMDGFSGSFSRLKVHNVRALIRKSKKMQKCIGKVNIGYQNALPNEEEDSEHHPIVLVREDKAVMGKGSVDKVNMATADVKHLCQNQEHGDASFGESSFGSLSSSEKNVEVREPFTPRNRSSLRGWASGRYVGKDETNAWKPSTRSRGLSAGREFFSRKSFKSLGCSDSMINALRNLNILRPSHIQALSYLPVLERRTCIIAEQSGSGKTLAYLSPVIQRLREDEAQGLAKSLPGRPRVVILVPTAELASQVLCICRLISKSGVPFRSMVTTGGFKQKTQVDNLREDVDILIATPGRLMFLLQEGSLQLNNLTCVVLDEVDVLFGDNDFEQVFQCLITSGPVAMQYIFVTATLPTDIYNKLIEAFPDSVAIMGPSLHQINSGLEEVLVDCSGDDREEKNPETAFLNKRAALLRLIEDSPASRTIIFCNKIESCRKVENMLHRYDRKGSKLRVLPFHAAVAQESRMSNMKEFCSAQFQGSLFLICTDRASRGIDFQKVDHVVLFDFPRDPSEYVRRVGRTARGAGGKGKAFVFVVGKQVFLARRIMERNKKGHPLHDVPSAELFV